MDELEDMMFMEAVRLSLAAEEDRARKQEKAERKEAKKRLKEERKAAKKAEKQGSIYGGSSATSSSLSLGLGRRRGNSAASNLRMEATVQGAQANSSAKSSERTSPTASSSNINVPDKGKGVDRPATEPEATDGSAAQASSSTSPSLPIPTSSRGPSHLRQMSNASSISSSLADSTSGSFTNQGHLSADPRASGTSLNRTEEAEANEPMFNFRSLAEMVGVDLENGEAVGTDGDGQNASANKKGDDEEARAEHAEDPRTIQESTATLKPPVIHEVPEEHGDSSSMDATPNSDLSTPQLMITPETPAALEGDGESKQLGGHSVLERSPAITH